MARLISHLELPRLTRQHKHNESYYSRIGEWSIKCQSARGTLSSVEPLRSTQAGDDEVRIAAERDS